MARKKQNDFSLMYQIIIFNVVVSAFSRILTIFLPLMLHCYIIC